MTLPLGDKILGTNQSFARFPFYPLRVPPFCHYNYNSDLMPLPTQYGGN